MFPNFDADLRAHLSEYGNEQTQAILAETSELSADYYDWTVTDLHSGQPNGTRAFAMMNGVGMISGDANGVPAEGSASVRNVPGVDGLPQKLTMSRMSVCHGIPRICCAQSMSDTRLSVIPTLM